MGLIHSCPTRLEIVYEWTYSLKSYQMNQPVTGNLGIELHNSIQIKEIN